MDCKLLYQFMFFIKFDLFIWIKQYKLTVMTYFVFLFFLQMTSKFAKICCSMFCDLN